MKTWQIEKTKEQLSEVVEHAQTGEMQVISQAGKEVAVVLSYKVYLELATAKRSVLDSLKNAPDLSVLKIERDEYR